MTKKHRPSPLPPHLPNSPTPHLLYLLLLFLLAACTTDAYDKGEGDYSLMRADMADIRVDYNKQALSATTDEGELLLFAKPFTASWFGKPDTVYRAVLYYNRVEGNLAQAVSASVVSVLRPHPIEGMKTHPVRFESAWLSSNRRYLNASIYVLIGDFDNDLLVQTIGMNTDTLVNHADGKRTLHLTLYHDQGGMPEYYSQRAFISVPLDTLDVDTVSLNIHTYDSLLTRQFCIR